MTRARDLLRFLRVNIFPSADPAWRRRKFGYIAALAMLLGLVSLVAAGAGSSLNAIGIVAAIAIVTFALLKRDELRPRQRHRVK